VTTADHPRLFPFPRHLAALGLALAALLSSPMPPAFGEGIRPDATLELIDATGGSITRIQVEIADTPRARARGLMHRSLPNDESGMLFIFPEAAPRSFWMRNTPGSLDILFADADRRIIRIARETRPMSDRTYASGGAAKYVLETRAGFAARHKILPGARFDYDPRPLRHHGPEQR
jgi:uncharacterized membrane protein (UPF0127 family)